jgi:hypothetical protein
MKCWSGKIYTEFIASLEFSEWMNDKEVNFPNKKRVLLPSRTLTQMIPYPTR